MLRSLAVLVALASCTAGQARHTKHASEMLTAAGLFAMLGTVVVAEFVPEHDQQLYMAGRICIPFVVLGAFTYAAADSIQPR